MSTADKDLIEDYKATYNTVNNMGKMFKLEDIYRLEQEEQELLDKGYRLLKLVVVLPPEPLDGDGTDVVARELLVQLDEHEGNR